MIALDKQGGPELVRRLAAEVDVFITNLTQPRRERYGLSDGDVLGVNPSVVYVSLTGYGTQGPDAGQAGFDYSAFWARSGIMGTLGQPPSPPPLNRGGQGDHTTSLNLLAATLAALRLRDATGRGPSRGSDAAGDGHVDDRAGHVGRTGGGSAAAPPRPKGSGQSHLELLCHRRRALDPAGDAAARPLLGGGFCAALSEPGWEHDFRYDSAAARQEYSAELVASIEERFARRDLAYWSARLDEFGLIWAPVAELPEVVADPQVAAMEWFAEIEHPQAGPFRTQKAPFTIRDAEMGPKGPAPSIGQHTHEILAAYGLSADEIADLAAQGILG